MLNVATCREAADDVVAGGGPAGLVATSRMRTGRGPGSRVDGRYQTSTMPAVRSRVMAARLSTVGMRPTTASFLSGAARIETRLGLDGGATVAVGGHRHGMA